ncbi:MAG TPA: KH domain-containing protein [Candidatus Caccopulliclostridium gallistercoris]|uniref:RNA-binding protein KhpA n=1 Tax=Candidatus Caccopulliclostridium gallistercoris TaxID=2840719 RepID=A0A9D1NF10_9FIRM|nr:KH domain-containing protein [Candidatus Caccopulliclostridium gallistercoris]
MEKLVEYIVKSLVDHPDEVKVTSKNDKNAVIIDVKTNEDDIGKVIGKNGRIISSIRTIVKNMSVKSNKKFIVKIG